MALGQRETPGGEPGVVAFGPEIRRPASFGRQPQFATLTFDR